MRILIVVMILIIINASKDIQKYQKDVDEIINHVKNTHRYRGYNKLAYMVDTFGNRYTGSPGYNDAQQWILTELKMFGNPRIEVYENETVSIRQQEHLLLRMPNLSEEVDVVMMIDSPSADLRGVQGITVDGYVDLFARGERGELKNKVVVVLNETDKQMAANWTSLFGGLGVLIVSDKEFVEGGVSLLRTNTFVSDYVGKKIPYGVIGRDIGEMLRRLQVRGVKFDFDLKFVMKVSSQKGGNIVAEYLGYDKPDEIVVVSAHLDSVGYGKGALDDGGGVISVMEAVRALIELGKRPRRTIRFIAFDAEETTFRGSRDYASRHGSEFQNHVMAFESDIGVFKPNGFLAIASKEQMETLGEIATLTKSIGTDWVRFGVAGEDILPLLKAKVPVSFISVESSDCNFFDKITHTKYDDMSRISPENVDLHIASIASFVYVVADMEKRL